MSAVTLPSLFRSTIAKSASRCDSSSLFSVRGELQKGGVFNAWVCPIVVFFGFCGKCDCLEFVQSGSYGRGPFKLNHAGKQLKRQKTKGKEQQSPNFFLRNALPKHKSLFFEDKSLVKTSARFPVRLPKCEQVRLGDTQCREHRPDPSKRCTTVQNPSSHNQLVSE